MACGAMVPDALRTALRRAAFPSEGDRVARQLAATIAERADGTQAVIFFGSRKSGAGANEASAHDMFVAVEDYGRFYRSLAREGWVARPRAAALLNHWLPPNVVSLDLPASEGGRALAKCAVITLSRLERETSGRRRDHFCIGRLFQPVEVVWTRDGAVAERVLALLESAARETVGWIRSSTAGAFDAEDYVRALLQVSLAGEIRPEPASRAERLLDAQREAILPVYGELLGELEAHGTVRAAAGKWQWARPAGRWEALRTRAYFLRSKIRATLRWSKYMITFEGWLDYLLRKVARHTGQEIVLTERERKFPLIFLWPRFFRYLREKEARPSR